MSFNSKLLTNLFVDVTTTDKYRFKLFALILGNVQQIRDPYIITHIISKINYEYPQQFTIRCAAFDPIRF